MDILKIFQLLEEAIGITFAKNFGFPAGAVPKYLQLKLRLQQTTTVCCNKLATKPKQNN